MNIAEMIKQIVQNGGTPSACMVCTVTAVDKTARTCDCEPLNEDAPLLGVNLQANQGSAFGVVIYPRVGSFVVVGFVAAGSAGAVLLTDDVEAAEIVVSDDTARAYIDESGIRMNMGEATSVELTKDGIVLNGGDLGGLVKVEDLTKRLNLIEKDINTLKSVFSGWTPVPQDGGGALKGSVATWAGGTLTETQRGDYENEKVKQ